MGMYDFANLNESIMETFAGGIVAGGLIAVMIIFAIVFLSALYVYYALAWQTIAKKQKHPKPWLAWIPFANLSMILQMGGFHWALVFLVLIPILGWIALTVLIIVSTWRIYEKAKYPGWLSLAAIIPKIGFILNAIAVGYVAWKKPKK